MSRPIKFWVLRHFRKKQGKVVSDSGLQKCNIIISDSGLQKYYIIISDSGLQKCNIIISDSGLQLIVCNWISIIF